jgi:hypothetical protein
MKLTASNRASCRAKRSNKIKSWCRLTLRSSGRPPARHLGREPVSVIIGLAAQAPRRRPPLSSNVRPRMPAPYSVDPDQFLDFTRATPFSREEGLAAWENAYARLREHLSELGSAATLYVVFGLQASGKTTWVRSQSAVQARDAIYFSGPLPSRKHRSRVVAMAKEFGCKAVAVHVTASLEVALARNAARSGLARVPEDVMRHVYESLEPATVAEGFSDVIEVSPTNAEA